MYICVMMCMYNLLCVDLVLDHQEAAHELDDSVRMKVREALLKRHHHQSDKKRNNLLPMVKSLTESGRRQSEPHSMDKTGELYVYCTGIFTGTGCTMCIVKEYFWLNTTLALWIALNHSDFVKGVSTVMHLQRKSVGLLF